MLPAPLEDGQRQVVSNIQILRVRLGGELQPPQRLVVVAELLEDGGQRVVVRARHRVPGYPSFEVLGRLVSELGLLSFSPYSLLHLTELAHALGRVGHGLRARRRRAALPQMLVRSTAGAVDVGCPYSGDELQRRFS